jgi:hypothetical protein
MNWHRTFAALVAFLLLKTEALGRLDGEAFPCKPLFASVKNQVTPLRRWERPEAED